jgi:hypothetical protein
MNGSGCSSGSTASQVQTQMAGWKSADGITGGFMWLYDNMESCTNGGTPGAYALAINTAVEPLQITPAAGFNGVAAYNLRYIPASLSFILTNTGSASLNWSLINTSLWLIASGSGTLAANGSAAVTVSLNPATATNLAFGLYSASILFSNRTSGIVQTRAFTLDTGVVQMPIALTGFNAALLAPNTATASSPGATAFDIPNDYCFYEAGLNGGTGGLPLNGAFPSQSDSGTAFQLGPYGAKDALLLGYDSPQSGTLTLTTPQAFNSLAILACSANGSPSSQGTLVVNFSNGTKSPVFNFNAQDWFYTVTNVAIQGFGRLKLGTSLTFDNDGNSNPNIYQTTLNLAALGLTQPVASITFSNPAAAGAQQTTAIFAVSGMAGTVPVRAPTGLVAVPGTNGTVQLSWNGSAGATNYNVNRSAVSGSSYATVGSTAGTNYTDTGLANGSTYYYVVSATGTINTSSNSSEVNAMPGSYGGWMLAGNPVAYWPLNETSGQVAYDMVSGNDGLSTGNYALGYPGFAGAGFGGPHRATHYDGSTASTQLPLLIGSTNFTIVFWVQTTAIAGSPNWYNGDGLVDGAVAGVTNDFGVALVGNRIGFGVGNPDTTLTSVRTINNGLWHQVAVTRDSGGGVMNIYIDGTLDASTNGPTGARTAPPNLLLARIQSGGGYLNGTLSDVAMYNRKLTANQIATLYSAAMGLFYNITLTNSWNGTNLVLTWPGNGILLEATNLAGPWTTNSGGSPFTATPTVPQIFYRIRTQ